MQKKIFVTSIFACLSLANATPDQLETDSPLASPPRRPSPPPPPPQPVTYHGTCYYHKYAYPPSAHGICVTDDPSEWAYCHSDHACAYHGNDCSYHIGKQARCD
ncbi:hypothetical protein K461DRAFT_97338 [Myriangium duriaei CBS 260.36]|uniref:Uncharacterized protein n=1 Tax=Myriangium duriaei CBS 260.36 TaxID=1168546 RepID=A0A9P4J710_9PEZI|nr:hypothetical protein K461DRAFT_97338 [Myriangium duriaei CBS 260.36]